MPLPPPHKTQTILINGLPAEVDTKIVDLVRLINRFPDAQTTFSCQGSATRKGNQQDKECQYGYVVIESSSRQVRERLARRLRSKLSKATDAKIMFAREFRTIFMGKAYWNIQPYINHEISIEISKRRDWYILQENKKLLQRVCLRWHPKYYKAVYQVFKELLLEELKREHKI